MRTRRYIASLAVLTASVLVLTGCGRSAAPEGDAAGSGVTVDENPATGTIEVWAMGEEGEKLKEFTSAFEKSNPEATVNVSVIPWPDYMTKVQTAVASGKTPDVTMVGSTDVAAAVDAGALAPVPENLTDNSKFFSSAVDSAKVDGVSYSVPWYVETRVFFYRSDLAKQMGLEAPKTWKEQTEFFAAAQAQGAKWGTSLFTGTTDSYQDVLPFLWQAGAEVISEDGSEWTFDTPEAIEGLGYYQSLIKDGFADPHGPVNLGEVEPDMVTGNLASIVAGPWESSLLIDAGGQAFYDDQIATAPLPAGPAGSVGWIGGAGFGVFKDAQNPVDAWKLVRWLSEADVQQQWFDASLQLPSVSAAWDYPAIVDNQKYAAFREQLENTNAPPAVTTWPVVAAEFDTQIEKVAAGTATPAEALADLQAKAESIGTGK